MCTQELGRFSFRDLNTLNRAHIQSLIMGSNPSSSPASDTFSSTMNGENCLRCARFKSSVCTCLYIYVCVWERESQPCLSCWFAAELPSIRWSCTGATPPRLSSCLGLKNWHLHSLKLIALDTAYIPSGEGMSHLQKRLVWCHLLVKEQVRDIHAYSLSHTYTYI